MEAKYVNPFTDFGFKKLFGEEANKKSLIDFLNALLSDRGRIKDLSFKGTEKLGQTAIDRKAVYDIYCENENGEKFIVELQKAKQGFFKERMVYYATFPIAEQAEKGNEWDYDLKAVYCIGILDFVFTDNPNELAKSKVQQTIKLTDEDCHVFYDKLTFIFLQMPNFIKQEQELETRLDKWLFFIKNLKDFQSIPKIFKNDVIFIETLIAAEIAQYSKEESDEYEQSIKVYRDMRNVINTAWKDGVKSVAKTLILNGMQIDVISKMAGLTINEINALQ